MSEDLATEIALVLVRLGYRDVHEEAGLVYYTEADGTKHRLVEDVKTTDGTRWESEVEK